MYFKFFDLYVTFLDTVRNKNVASLHDPRPAPAAAGTLISDASQLVLVEADLPDLGSCATPVVPELGGKACENPPRSGRRRSRLDPC
jgi:hypothetical protein